METVTLQVPISKPIKTSAMVVAKEYGFSSLQEIVRVLLTKLARRQLTIQIGEMVTPLSRRAERRYLKMEKDFAKGKNIRTFSNVDELMKDLRKPPSTL